MSRLFNGSSYIDCGNVTQLVSAKAFTLAFRCFKNTSADGVIITKGSDGARLLCEWWTDSTWYLYINSSTTTVIDRSLGWQWYAMTFDASLASGSRARFYRGTTLLATWCTASTVNSTTGSLFIGRDPIGGGFNNTSGTQFSHVQLYNRPLDRGSGNDLFNLMSDPLDRPSGCVGHWCQGPLNGVIEPDAMQNWTGRWTGTPQYGTSTPPNTFNRARGPRYGNRVA